MKLIKNTENLTNEIILSIPERFITDNTFSNYSLAVYCVLRTLSQPTQLPILCITQNQIEFYLTGRLSKRRLISDYIKCGINELVDNHIIGKVDEQQKHYILDCSNLCISNSKDFFTVITFGEVQKIFNVENVNNFLLLRYFVSLISTISSKITVYLDMENIKIELLASLRLLFAFLLLFSK